MLCCQIFEISLPSCPLCVFAQDYFKGEKALNQIERSLQHSDEAASELLTALGRGQLRASQFPEYSTAREQLDSLRRQSDSLRTLHTKTIMVLQELGDLWEQLFTSCKELETYVAESRQLFPTEQVLAGAGDRHDLCSSKLHVSMIPS